MHDDEDLDPHIHIRLTLTGSTNTVFVRSSRVSSKLVHNKIVIFEADREYHKSIWTGMLQCL